MNNLFEFFIGLFRNNLIEKRVMSKVKEVIRSSQNEYDKKTEEMEVELEDTIVKLEKEFESAKVQLVEEMVRDVFKKLKE